MVVIDSITAQDRLLRRRKQLIAVGLITTGGVSGVHIIRKILRDALQEQLKICSSVDAL